MLARVRGSARPFPAASRRRRYGAEGCYCLRLGGGICEVEASKIVIVLPVQSVKSECFIRCHCTRFIHGNIHELLCPSQVDFVQETNRLDPRSDLSRAGTWYCLPPILLRFSNQTELYVLRVGTQDKGVCSINLKIFSINKKKSPFKVLVM